MFSWMFGAAGEKSISPARRRYEDAKREVVRVDVYVESSCRTLTTIAVTRYFRLQEVGQLPMEDIPWYISARSAADQYVDRIMQNGVDVVTPLSTTRLPASRIARVEITTEQATEV